MAEEITVVASDGRRFCVPRRVAEMSVTIKNMLESLPDLTEEIPLMNVTAVAFEKVLQFCERHLNDATMSKTEWLEWRNKALEGPDAELTNIDSEASLAAVFELTLVANFLDVPLLLSVCCKSIATFIKSRTPEEVKALLGITEDFAEAEIAAGQSDHPWLLHRDFYQPPCLPLLVLATRRRRPRLPDELWEMVRDHFLAVRVFIEKDSRRFAVAPYVAEACQKIASLQQEYADQEIPLAEISSTAFEQVLLFCEHHKDDAEMTAEERQQWKELPLEGFDAEFTKIERDLAPIYDRTLAANYLGYKQMLDVCCKAIAGFIKSKTPDQIKEFLGVEDDFTDEEIAAAKAEHNWLRDVTLPARRVERA